MSSKISMNLINKIFDNCPTFFVSSLNFDKVKPVVFSIGNISEFDGNINLIKHQFSDWLTEVNNEPCIPCGVFLHIEKDSVSYKEVETFAEFYIGRMIPHKLIVDSDGEIILKDLQLSDDLVAIGSFSFTKFE